jgi:membrane fusion protein, heavy metal efflux system
MRRSTLVFVLCAGLVACESEAEREREQRRQVQAKSSVAPDGSIRLTAEQIRTNNIQTSVAAEEDIAPGISVPGRVKPRAGGESGVFAPFAGRLVADPARVPRPGSEVRDGQLLGEVEQIFPASERLQITATSLQLQTGIDQSRQELDLSRKELDRARQLYEGGAIPLKQLQTAEFNVGQAQSKLDGTERAKAAYDDAVVQQSEQRRTPIRAPIAGTVVSVDLVAGQQVDPAKSLLTIVDTSALWVELAVPEHNLPQIGRTTSAAISAPSNPNRIYRGRLVNIGSTVDPQNRTVPVTFSVANEDKSLKLDMYVEGRIATGPQQKTVIVPASALVSEQGISSVFVETEPGVFWRRIVTAGPRQAGKIVILSGVKPGEKVVSLGAQALNSETLKTLIPTGEEGGRR